MAATLPKDTVLAEGSPTHFRLYPLKHVTNGCVTTSGYSEYDTGRQYMAKMGDWRNNKDDELELDGIGGVNILVKADVHRSG